MSTITSLIRHIDHRCCFIDPVWFCHPDRKSHRRTRHPCVQDAGHPCLSSQSGHSFSGTMLLKYTFGLNGLLLFLIGICVLILLFLIYRKNKKINTVAVMTGAFGYVMIYLSMITLSFRNKIFLSAVFSVMAIFLFVMLCGIGIKANLKDPKVHWKIEISNVICQGLVALAAVLLF